VPRSPITRARIEAFLTELGRLYRGAGRLYLVGGNLEVFTFDPISTCLSKIARGTGPGIDDVLALVAAGLVQRDQRIAAFEEIVPRLARESLRVDESDFRRKFQALLDLVDKKSSEAAYDQQPEPGDEGVHSP
jgi:hypothetical protein